jgi:hypothetical protein
VSPHEQAQVLKLLYEHIQQQGGSVPREECVELFEREHRLQQLWVQQLWTRYPTHLRLWVLADDEEMSAKAAERGARRCAQSDS